MKKFIFLLILNLTFNILNLCAQSPNWLWAKNPGGIGSEYGNGIAVDGSGSSFVTGSFYSPSITFGTTTLTNAGAADIFLVKYDAGGNAVWATSAGGTGDDYGYSIAVDGNGNSYVTGYFNSPSITFDTIALTNPGSSEIFLVKYDAGGNVVWAKSAGGTADDFGYSIAVDESGNSYVTGYFKSPSITFGTTTLTNANAGFFDIFLVKYDVGGNAMWATSAGGTGDDYGYSIAVDSSGSSFVTGSFESPSITFGTTTLTNAGGADIFIVKFDAGGNSVWAKSTGETGEDKSNSIAVDGSGSSYVTGWFTSPSITFGTTTLTNASAAYDFFIVKYDAGGNVLWAKSAGGSEWDLGYGIVVDGSGSSFVTGSFEGPSITFGSTTLINVNTVSPFPDIFIVKYDAGGNVMWAKSAGGISEDISYSIAVDGSGNSYVTGFFASSSITFGSTTVTLAGPWEMFVAKLANTITEVNELEQGAGVSVLPNPFSNSTTVSFLVSRSEKVSLQIFDVNGRLVSTLADNIFEAGDHQIEFNAEKITAGIYFLKMQSGKLLKTEKLIVTK